MRILINLKNYVSSVSNKNLNNKIININLKENSKVLNLIKEINIPKERISLITINNSVSSLDSKLKDGDKVVFYPPVGGG